MLILTFGVPVAMTVSIAALLTLAQVAPVSVLRKIPLLPELVNSVALFEGSLAKSKEGPAGNPVPAAPEICVHDPPVSVLRHTPRLANESAALPATTMTAPRGATPEMFNPVTVPPAPLTSVQLAPPLVVRHTPTRSLPRDKKLLNLPTPAINVCRVASVGSNAIAPIDSARLTPSCSTQLGVVAVALVVFQMPPLTAPT